MEENILKADEVANILRLDKQRVYELVRRQQIPFIRIGERQYRFSRRAINSWLEKGGTSNLASQENKEYV